MQSRTGLLDQGHAKASNFAAKQRTFMRKKKLRREQPHQLYCLGYLLELRRMFGLLRRKGLNLGPRPLSRVPS
jgi:hypothetical protein